MTSLSPDIPLRRADITPAWLTVFLGHRHPGVVVDDLEVLSATQGAATRLRLGVRYAEGRDAGLPETLFIKGALTRRMLVSDPHMYVTEVYFYDRIRPAVDVEAPEAFAWAVDPPTGRHALVMEDLDLRHASYPSAVTTVSADDLAPLVSGLADLHAAHWGHRDLAGRYPWLETSTTGKSAQWWRSEARSVAEHELAAAPYKAELVTGHPLDRLFEAHAALQRRNAVGPRTVVHGDTHIGNTYLLPGGGGGLLDWQLMMIAGWACDLAYLLVTALDVPTRRACERDLIGDYLARLGSAGVTVPTWDQAWADYRAQMVWGIVTWMVTPTAMYDQARLTALLERCTTAAEDLESYRLLAL